MIGIIIAAIVTVIIVFACCKVAGECSQLEEDKKVVAPKVEEPRFYYPPMDLRMKYEFEEDLSDGALE